MRKYPIVLLLIIAFITGLSFVYRFLGITSNHPFWVDEFATADQALVLSHYGFSVFTNPQISFEHHNITTHALAAVSMFFFGKSEWAVRLPFVLIGSLVPAAVFVLSRHLFNIRTGVVASLFTTFSYFMITWSRQARGYTILQLITLLTLYSYVRWMETRPRSLLHGSILICCIFLGILTHTLYYIVLGAILIHAFIFYRQTLNEYIRKPLSYGAIAIAAALLWRIGAFSALGTFFSFQTTRVNNVWYYHSFLWREYGLITFLAALGFTFGLFAFKRSTSLLALYTGLHLIFLSFLFGPYVSRYLLPVFPILFIATAAAIVTITDLFLMNKRVKRYSIKYAFVPLLIVMFIVANGHKFVTKPKKYYSVNHDFREIALIDYHDIYGRIKKGIDERTVVIDTWPSRTRWYLGREFKNLYILRNFKDTGITNGIPRATIYELDKNGETVFAGSDERITTDLKDLRVLMKNYPKGYLFIDDAALPADIRAYAEKNFKKELVTDHYTLDDNPYSMWPATLYSWGI